MADKLKEQNDDVEGTDLDRSIDDNSNPENALERDNGIADDDDATSVGNGTRNCGDNTAVRVGKGITRATDVVGIGVMIGSTLFPSGNAADVQRPVAGQGDQPVQMCRLSDADVQQRTEEQERFQQHTKDSVEALAELKARKDEAVMDESKAIAAQEEKDRLRGARYDKDKSAEIATDSGEDMEDPDAGIGEDDDDK